MIKVLGHQVQERMIAMGAFVDVDMEAIQRRLMFGDECVRADEK